MSSTPIIWPESRTYAVIANRPYPLSWLIDDTALAMSKRLDGVNAESLGKALSLAVKLAGAQKVAETGYDAETGAETADGGHYHHPSAIAPIEWLQDTVQDVADVWMRNASAIAGATQVVGGRGALNPHESKAMADAIGVGHNRYRAWQRRQYTLDATLDGDASDSDVDVFPEQSTDEDFTEYINGKEDAARLWQLLPPAVRDAAKSRLQGKPLTPGQRKTLSRYAARATRATWDTFATRVVRDVRRELVSQSSR